MDFNIHLKVLDFTLYLKEMDFPSHLMVIDFYFVFNDNKLHSPPNGNPLQLCIKS